MYLTRCPDGMEGLPPEEIARLLSLRRRCFAAGLVILGLAVGVLYVLESRRARLQSTETVSAQPTPSEPASDALPAGLATQPVSFSSEVDGKVVLGNIVKGLGIAIFRVESQDSIQGEVSGKLVTARARGRFKIVHMVVSNLGADPTEVTPALFGLVDEKGKIYGPSEEGNHAVGTLRRSTLDRRLSKGEQTYGTVVFDVPGKADVTLLAVRFRPAKSSEPEELATVPLEVRYEAAP
jgi:hypothetical protein